MLGPTKFPVFDGRVTDRQIFDQLEVNRIPIWMELTYHYPYWWGIRRRARALTAA